MPTRNTLANMLNRLLGRTDEVPYGYQLVDGEQVEQPGEQKILRFIEQLHAHGYSYVSIAKRLNNGGLLRRKSRKWKARTIQKLHLDILNSKFHPLD